MYTSFLCFSNPHFDLVKTRNWNVKASGIGGSQELIFQGHRNRGIKIRESFQVLSEDIEKGRRKWCEGDGTSNQV